MDNQVLESLGLESPDEALVLLILTISGERRTATANLQGPLVLNPKRRLGRQLVLQVPGYTTRHSILRGPELERANEAKAAQKTC
jgi:flagellar assembly factor FliW